MKEYKNGNKAVIIILHEIYGINRFIEELCIQYHNDGFDIFCPQLLGRENFPYEDSAAAHAYFFNEVGFDVYKKVEEQIKCLKLSYKKVFVLGFSVGATIAWRCSETSSADGIICCYGSRIRDYLQVKSCCPVLLLFAEYDSFDVQEVINKLKYKENVEVVKLKTQHGFLDKYNESYDKQQAKVANDLIKEAMRRYGK
jgi:dienelactone hydrolase